MIKNSLGKKPSIILPGDLSDSDATKWGLKEYYSDKSGGSRDITYNNSTKATMSIHEAVGGTLDAVPIGILIPYQMQSGVWRLRFNINSVLSGTNRNDIGLRINGIVFNLSSGCSCSGNYGTVPVRVYTGSNDNYFYSQIRATFSPPINSTEYWISGDVSLASKPTWAY